MPLESCMLVLDNSEYMRNGDYPPTRFQAQAEAVSTVFSAKTDANPESAVGLMTMAGNAPSLLVTPTNDIGKLLASLAKVQVSGIASISTAISIAQLALKHRENKNQRQRIVVFVGSPLDDSPDSLVKLGKRLRKNNVLIDIVSFGEEGRENDEKLTKLIEAAGDGESHLVSIPPGPHFLSDVIASSPILFDGERAMPGGSGGEGAGGGFEDGIDPNMDPELAMAIRMSLQEAQEAAARANPPAAVAEGSGSSAPAPIGQSAVDPAQGDTSGSGAVLPDAMTAPLSNAHTDVPMVSGDAGEVSEHAGASDETPAVLAEGDVDMMEDDEEDEEAAIARAIAMSLEEGKEQQDKEPQV
ncbi:hypothetical protein IAU60_000076 [Kwoniella sp. DSM 27419]